MIESHLNGKVLNVENGYANAGARIILWKKEYPPPTNELFSFQDAGNGWFHIVSALDPNMVVDVEGGYANNGAKLILYQRQHPPKPNQLFQWHGQALRSALGSDMVLDVEGGNTNDGAGVVLWPHKSGYSANQSWRVA